MYHSLKEKDVIFTLYILCLDKGSHDYLSNRKTVYPEIVTISLDEIEAKDSELKNCKSNRSIIEYYFTLSPCLPLYVLNEFNLPHICSLDADIFFIQSPENLFNYLDDFSVVITPHKFSEELQALLIYGCYNVSFQIFKNDKTGNECLRRWREQCIEWCYDSTDESGRFADQKYLDEWPKLYGTRLKALYDNVSGIAPWNLNNFNITKRKNVFYSNGEKIIFYHFHHFKILSKLFASNGFISYKVKMQKAVDQLYLLYWKNLNRYKTAFGKSDLSVRNAMSENKWDRIFTENFIYYKVLNLLLVPFKISRLPAVLKILLRKL